MACYSEMNSAKACFIRRRWGAANSIRIDFAVTRLKLRSQMNWIHTPYLIQAHLNQVLFWRQTCFGMNANMVSSKAAAEFLLHSSSESLRLRKKLITERKMRSQRQKLTLTLLYQRT